MELRAKVRSSGICQWVAITCLGTLQASCQTASQQSGTLDIPAAEPVFLRRIENPGEIYLTASASGILSLKGGCFMLGATSIVWPSNSRLSRDEKGRISVINTSTGQSVEVGRRIAMGGGEVNRLEPSTLEERGARLGQCPAPYFVADNNFRPE